MNSADAADSVGTLALDLGLGAGVSVNRLYDITERLAGATADFANVNNATMVSPAAKLSASLRYHPTSRVAIFAESSASYAGKFESGTTRTEKGSGAVSTIGAYKLKDLYDVGIRLGMSIALN